MSHTKLYRNFIILQPDECNRKTADGKDLSGYAKIEAKGEKCRVSFYVQNLNPDEKYSMVLICSKKDSRQLLSLGNLSVDKNGKGENSNEYFVSSIGGENISYEKITGAAILKEDGSFANYIMYGFVNGQDVNENWKNFKVIRCYADHKTGQIKQSYFYEKPSSVKKEPEEKEIKVETPKKDEIKKVEIQNDTIETPNESTSEVREEPKEEKIINKEEIPEDVRCKDKKKKDECKDKKKKDECIDIEKHIREQFSKIKDCADIDVCVNEKGNFIIYAIVKNKDTGKIKKYVKEVSSKEKMMSKRLHENLELDLDDFDDYERNIPSSDNEVDQRKHGKFNICGKDGKFFESIADLFRNQTVNLKISNIASGIKSMLTK